ncbi:MAG: DUF3592 domain-containing protein [Clostridiales bacterium]|nr:DUF3592 domain-containing protein [Clostridiales bacterium]
MKKVTIIKDSVDRPPLMILVPFILLGLAILSIGLYLTHKQKIETRNYIETIGIFVDSSVYSNDEDGTTYSLTYRYRVNGKYYFITTDYGTGSVPSVGSEKTIKYNPNNPSEAIITGFNSYSLILFFGGMCTFIPLVLIVNSAFFANFVILFLGILVYYIMGSSSDDLSLGKVFKTNGIFTLVPLLFIGAGIINIVYFIFNKDKFKSSSQENYVEKETITINRELTKEEKRNYYKNERPELITLSMFIVGLFMMVFLTVLKLKDPDNWAPNGYLIAMGFMFFFTLIMFGFAYTMSLKPLFEERKNKLIAIANGKQYHGVIVDNKKTVASYVNGKPHSYNYSLKIEYTDINGEIKTIWTPHISFKLNKLASNDVIIYEYDYIQYVGGYQFIN